MFVNYMNLKLGKMKKKKISKDEMIEKAVDAYISTCADRVFGLCSTVSSRTPSLLCFINLITIIKYYDRKILS